MPPEIPVVEGLTPERFARDYFAPRRPVKIAGAMRDWPALGKWTFEFFETLGRDVHVEAEVGDCLTRAAARQQWTLDGYIGAITENRLSIEAQQHAVPYLSVFPLFEYFPELRADIGHS